MYDSIQGVELVLVGEDYLTQSRPVESAVILEDVLSPPLHDIPHRLGFGFNRLARQLVGVNECGTTFGKHFCYL